MDTGFQEKKDKVLKHSSLLELAADNNLTAFIYEIEEKGCDLDDVSFWYGRKFGSKKMGFEERTPLMIAALYGSSEIVEYIIGTGGVDVNRASSSDSATALHCAAAGGAEGAAKIVKFLIDSSADVNCVDANGNKPGDFILKFSRKKELEILLTGCESGEEDARIEQVVEKKEYPVDVALPDINVGLYGTDDFRMYSFKVKPCSRAYSHDWTECPFVHPGENARRRDPKKYTYSCVPCPEFRKGSCVKGDNCEYAHGVFESWLHPAQYRTRLCKDETGCARKVCFFAHRVEELRPLYASTGSAMPSPKSGMVGSMDMGSLSPRGMGGSTTPMSPSVACSSPMGGNLWQNKVNLTPPALQLPGSRLKTALNARDMDLELELLGLGSIRTQQQRQLIDDLSNLSSPSMWNNSSNRFGEMNPTNLEDVFGSPDSSYLSQLQGLSPRVPTRANTPQMQSPTGHQMRQNMNQLRASYPTNASSSPSRKAQPTYGFDSSAAVAAAVMNSRSSAFAKQRSQSFIDRGAVSLNRPAGFSSAAANSASMMSSNQADWSSPSGKLDWGYQEDMNKLRKSASFGFGSGNGGSRNSGMHPSFVDEPDVSWVNSLVKDVSSTGAGLYSSDQKHNAGNGVQLPAWAEQMYIEQEQMVA